MTLYVTLNSNIAQISWIEVIEQWWTCDEH